MNILWAIFFGCCVVRAVAMMMVKPKGHWMTFAHTTLWGMHIPEGTPRSTIVHEKTHLYTGFPWIILLAESFGWVPWYLAGFGLWSILLWIPVRYLVRWAGEGLADTISGIVVGFHTTLKSIQTQEEPGARAYLQLPSYYKARFWSEIIQKYPPYRWLIFAKAAKAVREEKKS